MTHEAVRASLVAVEGNPFNAFTAAAREPPDDSLADRRGPLAMVPVAVKDIIDHQGSVTTAGSSFFRRQATSTARALTRLEEAGAVVVGRTGLHEFAFGFSSENDWFGPVHNPWDPTTSPGGSSGGSGAAVAAGIVPLALGTDTGGSVRVPAALCGCFGLKVTHGRIPITGVFPLAPSLDTVGPLASSMSLLAIAYRAMAGPDENDPWSVPVPVAPPQSVALDDLVIGIPVPWTDRPLEDRISRSFEDLVQRLRTLGATVRTIAVEEAHPRHLPDAAYAEVAKIHRRWFTEDPERYGPAIRDRVEAALTHDADAVAGAWEWRSGLTHAFARAFAEIDLLLTPTVPTSRKVIGMSEVDAGDGPEPYRRALSWFTVLVNQAGLPAIAVPLAGTDGPGSPPVSVQFIGPRLSESLLIGVGTALESEGIAGFVAAHS